jgi:hypothetical protein
MRNNPPIIVKNLFGLIRLLFSASSVYYKLYRQVLTPIDNIQGLLRQPIFDKNRLVAFHIKVRQRNYTNWFLLVRENESANNTLIHCVPLRSQSLLSACHKLMMLSFDV